MTRPGFRSPQLLLRLARIPLFLLVVLLFVGNLSLHSVRAAGSVTCLSPGYYFNRGNGTQDHITSLLPNLPVSLSTDVITALENNGVGNGHGGNEAAAQFFTIELNFAAFLQTNHLTASTIDFTYNGVDVFQTLQTLAGYLSAPGGTLSVSDQVKLAAGVASLAGLATDGCGSGTLTSFTPPAGGPGGPGGGTATPELGSGELLATAILPIGLALYLRRRRNQRIVA